MGKKVIKLNESDLKKIVSRVIKENEGMEKPMWKKEMERDVNRVASGIGNAIAEKFDLMENYREINQMIEDKIIEEFGSALGKYYSSFEY